MPASRKTPGGDPAAQASLHGYPPGVFLLAGIYHGRTVAAGRNHLRNGCRRHHLRSDAFHTLAPDSVIDQPAMFIMLELISDNASMIELMHPLPRDHPMIHVPGPKQPVGEHLMKVVVANEHEAVCAQAEIETNIDNGATVKSPTAVD